MKTLEHIHEAIAAITRASAADGTVDLSPLQLELLTARVALEKARKIAFESAVRPARVA